MYVDDIDIGSHANAFDVVRNTFGATRMLVYGLERKLLATVSRSKSVVLGSWRHVRKQLSELLTGLHFKVAFKGKKLGCDFTLGNGRVVDTSRGGLKLCKGRGRRFHIL